MKALAGLRTRTEKLLNEIAEISKESLIGMVGRKSWNATPNSHSYLELLKQYSNLNSVPNITGVSSIRIEWEL